MMIALMILKVFQREINNYLYLFIIINITIYLYLYLFTNSLN